MTGEGAGEKDSLWKAFVLQDAEGQNLREAISDVVGLV